jgi:hypothetical protein
MSRLSGWHSCDMISVTQLRWTALRSYLSSRLFSHPAGCCSQEESTARLRYRGVSTVDEVVIDIPYLSCHRNPRCRTRRYAPGSPTFCSGMPRILSVSVNHSCSKRSHTNAILIVRSITSFKSKVRTILKAVDSSISWMSAKSASVFLTRC